MPWDANGKWVPENNQMGGFTPDPGGGPFGNPFNSAEDRAANLQRQIDHYNQTGERPQAPGGYSFQWADDTRDFEEWLAYNNANRDRTGEAAKMKAEYAAMTPDQKRAYASRYGVKPEELDAYMEQSFARMQAEEDRRNGITPEIRAERDRQQALQQEYDTWRQSMWNFNPEDPWVQQQGQLAQGQAEQAARLRGIGGPMSTANTEQALTNAYVDADMQRKGLAMGVAGMQNQMSQAQSQLDFARQNWNREGQWRNQDRQDAYNAQQYMQGKDMWSGGLGLVGGALGGYFGGPAGAQAGYAVGSGLGGAGYGAMNPAPKPSGSRTGGY